MMAAGRLTVRGMSDAAPSPEGPRSYRNWRAFVAGKPLFSQAEIPIYSDVSLTVPDSDDLGPYKLKHAFPAELRDPVLVLLVHDHLDPGDLPRMDTTKTEGFTGASSGDEVAALLSLSLGRRLLAGSATRTCFQGKQDWTIFGDRDRPTFFRPTATRWFGHKRSVLPRATVDDAKVTTAHLSTFPKIQPSAATALVRAARLYRDALWIVETEPELAWLLLVSALEVAAVHQHVETPLPDILRLSKPKLAERLDAINSSLTEEVAKELSRELRATARFLGFMGRHLPPEPDLRPPQWARIDWSPGPMKKAFEKIYKYRSLAL